MLFTNTDNILKCKFLLPAGSASSNPAVSAVFNQYRSTLLDKFVEEFDNETSHLPADLSLLTIVYLPLPGSNADSVIFEVNFPTVGFWFKKLFKVGSFSNSNLKYLELPALDVLRLALLRNYNVNFQFIKIRAVKKFFYMYYHSLKSYTSILYRKEFFFTITYLNSFGLTFYKFQNTKAFANFFKR